MQDLALQIGGPETENEQRPTLRLPTKNDTGSGTEQAQGSSEGEKVWGLISSVQER